MFKHGDGFKGSWIVRRRTADRVYFAGEKGSCDLFPTRMLPVPAGIGLLPGKFGFCGYGRDTSAVRTKTQLAQYETKSGVIPQRAKKWVGAYFWSIGSVMPIDNPRFDRSYIHTYSYRYGCLFDGQLCG